MGDYDAAMKVILAHCRQAALEYFLGLEVEESQILELPQETSTIRRTDFPIRVRTADGRTFIVLLEAQSRWETTVPLRMLEYDARYRLKTGLSVLPVVLLLTPSRQVMECFEDEGIRYLFKVISLAAMDAKAVFDLGNPCLLPFVALMKGGRELFDQAEKGIYNSPLDRGDKADLLTGMALLSGLVSRELPTLLLKRRKDIMIESAGYELIKQEGIKEGIQQGIQQGIQRGVEQGIQQGTLATMRDNVIEVLELRFDEVPLSILRRIKAIDDPDLLKIMHKKAIQAESLDAFKSIMIRLLDSED